MTDNDLTARMESIIKLLTIDMREPAVFRCGECGTVLDAALNVIDDKIEYIIPACHECISDAYHAGEGLTMNKDDRRLGGRRC